MAEENQEQVKEVVQEEPKVETPEVSKEKLFTEAEVGEIIENRIARERSNINKRLGVNDIDIAVNAVKTQKELEEKQKIQKGEFEEILKTRTQEHQKEKEQLENQLRDIKINKSLLSSASKQRAINPDQVVDLLKKDMRLNESGNVEILDSNGIARYNKLGELLTTDELVQEFLTQNPHFVSATPSGSGSVSNVDRTNSKQSFKLEELDMNNPEDRKKYAEYRKQRNSKPYVINSNL
tara:strand:- start:2109 stop:2819 length:711 start_codon:yes stop_codon:yes gene_type:complete